MYADLPTPEIQFINALINKKVPISPFSALLL